MMVRFNTLVRLNENYRLTKVLRCLPTRYAKLPWARKQSMIAGFMLLLSLFRAESGRTQLPDRAKEALNIAFTVNWNLSTDDFFMCDLNGDTLADYVLKLTLGKDSSLVEYRVALIADSDGYGLFLLSVLPAWENLSGERIVLHRKGDTLHDFENLDQNGEPRRLILGTDAIEFIPTDGCCPSTFVFKKGRFHLYTTGD